MAIPRPHRSTTKQKQDWLCARRHLWQHLDTEGAIRTSANYWQALYTIAAMMKADGLYSSTTIDFDIAQGIRHHIRLIRRRLETDPA